MRTARRLPRPQATASPATATAANASVTSAKLPHEHDESPAPPTPERANVEQAASDVAAGQVDTDNYTRARTVAERK